MWEISKKDSALELSPRLKLFGIFALTKLRINISGLTHLKELLPLLKILVNME